MSRWFWLTNTSSYSAARVMEELNLEHTPARNLQTSEPRATDPYSISDLRKMGMVGIYEVK